MGNWNIAGIVLIVGTFFTLLTYILAQIHVTNPYTGMESNVLQTILSWLSPF